MKRILKATTFIIACLTGLLVVAVNDSQEVFIESKESKTTTGGPVFNKIKWFQFKDKDVWMMNQSHHGSLAGANPILARRFDGAAKSALTYFIFGTSEQHYMVHFLTDDESSFDQIVAVEVLNSDLKKVVAKNGGALVTVPNTPENELMSITDNSHEASPNNKWKLPTSPLGKTVSVTDIESSVTGQVKIVGEIYFNSNDDLRK